MFAHVIGAAVLLGTGTGTGIAFFMLLAHSMSGDEAAQARSGGV